MSVLLLLLFFASCASGLTTTPRMVVEVSRPRASVRQLPKHGCLLGGTLPNGLSYAILNLELHPCPFPYY